MLKLPTDIVQPGMVLARPITDDMGRTLLRQGVALTDEYIAVLKQRGMSLVFVAADDTNTIQIDPTIPDDARLQAQQTVARVFEFVQQLLSNADVPPAEAVTDPDVAQAIQNSPNFEQLEKTIGSLLPELFDKRTLVGLSQIRGRGDWQFSHAVNVAVIAMLIGVNLHLSLEDLIRLGVGCLLHDIGKIFFAPNLLRLNGQTDNRIRLREHPRLGYELLRNRNPDNVMINHVPLEHHERQDGLGYPRGLRGTNSIERTRFGRENILLISEIASVADVYDVLSNASAQPTPLTPTQVTNTMRRLAGTFLNREIVNILLAMLPVFPVGMNIILKSGRYANYKGVVLEANSKQAGRPIIRLLFNPHGVRISPIDLNLATKEDLVIEATL